MSLSHGTWLYHVHDSPARKCFPSHLEISLVSCLSHPNPSSLRAWILLGQSLHLPMANASVLVPPWTYSSKSSSPFLMSPQVDLQTVKLFFASLLRHRFLSHSCEKASPFPGSSECRFLNTRKENLQSSSTNYSPIAGTDTIQAPFSVTFSPVPHCLFMIFKQSPLP